MFNRVQNADGSSDLVDQDSVVGERNIGGHIQWGGFTGSVGAEAADVIPVTLTLVDPAGRAIAAPLPSPIFIIAMWGQNSGASGLNATALAAFQTGTNTTLITELVAGKMAVYRLGSNLTSWIVNLNSTATPSGRLNIWLPDGRVQQVTGGINFA